MPQFAVYPSLKDRCVFITGGSSGIGASIVEQFCAQGSQVIFVGLHEENAQKVIATIKQKKYPAPTFFPCDLRDIASLKNIITKINDSFGAIQVLVNNAGSDERHHTLDITEVQWREIMAVNLDHQFFAAQAVVPGMIAAGGGSIINMSSNTFLLAQNDDYIGYMTAKAAIVGLTRGLAKEFGAHKIRVNSILPGWVMTQRQIEKWLTKEAEVELLKTQALKEKLIPEDVARLALFLAADDSRMCSKQMFVVDAGRI